MGSHTSLKRKWRRWLKVIDREIFDQIREDKLIFERYCGLVQANETIQAPANFHAWVLANHGRSVLLQVRRLADNDSRTYSLRRVIGSIAQHPELVTRHAYLLSYPQHHRDYARKRWKQYTNGTEAACLPKSVPYADLTVLAELTRKIGTMVNRDVAHMDRIRRKRLTSWDDVYKALRGQVSLAAKYGDLVGHRVADDLDNFVITYDWMSIFDRPWRVGPGPVRRVRGGMNLSDNQQRASQRR